MPTEDNPQGRANSDPDGSSNKGGVKPDADPQGGFDDDHDGNNVVGTTTTSRTTTTAGVVVSR